MKRNSYRKQTTDKAISERKKLTDPSPQEEGRMFERLMAQRYNLDLTKGSGSGKWEKLDAYDQDLVVSCKYTTKTSINITSVMIDEAKGAAFGAGGRGADIIPVILAGLSSGEVACVIDPDDFFYLLDEIKSLKNHLENTEDYP